MLKDGEFVGGTIGIKKLWNIYHIYDVDGGYGDAVQITDLVGTVSATDEQIDLIVEYWNKPRVYAHPYDDLTEHTIIKEEVKPIYDLVNFEPYDPKTRLWPDIPRIKDGVCSYYEYNEITQSWFDPNEEEK